MALTVNKQPEVLSPAGNPIVVKIEGDAYSVTGNEAGIIILIDDPATTSDVFALDFSGTVYSWEGVASVADYMTEFYAVGGMTEAQVAASLYASIITIKAIVDDFIVQYNSDDNLYFYGRNKDAAKEIHLEASTTFDCTETEIGVAVDPVITTNYKVNMAVFIQNTDNDNPYSAWNQPPLLPIFTKIGEDAITPDISGIATFNIAEYLKAYLISEFTFDSAVKHNLELCRKYYIQYWLSSGDPVTNDILQYINNLYAFGGAISKKMLAELNQNESSFYDTVEDCVLLHKSLTGLKIPSTSRVEFFSFINLTAETTLWLTVKYNYTDGSTATKNIFSFPSVQYRAHNVRVDIPLILSTESKVTETIELRICDSIATVLIEKGTFIIDYEFDTFPQKNIILYKNSLGGYDTLYFSGKSDEIKKYSAETATIILPLEHVVTDGENASFNNSEFVEKTINSGYVSQEVIESFRDLLLSQEVYYIDMLSNAFNLYKIISGTGEVITFQTNSFFYNLEYKFSYSIIENAYSTGVLNSYINECWNGDFALNSSGWTISLDDQTETWEIHDGYARYIYDAAGGFISMDILEIGETYRIQLDIDWASAPVSGDSVGILLGDTASDDIETEGHIDIELTCTTTTLFKVFCISSSNFNCDIRNIKVYKIS